MLDAIQAANLKVLRLFISETFENFKRTGSVYMPDIEPQTVGVYDNTQLEAIDQLMVEAHDRGKVAFPPAFSLQTWSESLTDLACRHQASHCSA